MNQQKWDATKEHWFFVGHADGRHEAIHQVGWPKMLYDGGTITSRSKPYDSEEEMRADRGIHDACSMCGQPFDTGYMEPTKSRLIDQHICFNCDFWRNEIKPGGIVIEGRHYQVGPEPQPGQNTSFLGMAGREFHIQMNDGRMIVTHNLWTQGEVPAHFRERYPDNAQFTDGAGFQKVGEHGGAWNASRSEAI